MNADRAFLLAADGPRGPGASLAATEVATGEGTRAELAAMADLGVCVTSLDEVMPVDGADEETVLRAGIWVDRLLAAAGYPSEVALARWVAAVVAERCGDVCAAADDLVLAVDADPLFAPAVDWFARYASDQGDAAEALRWWRRLRNPNPEDLRTLEVVARAPGWAPGRNEPCWCDSGRKYKLCHPGQAAPIALAGRVEWLWRKAVSYTERRGGMAKDAVVRAATARAATARAADPNDEASVETALADPIVVDTVLVEGGWFARFLDERRPLLPADEILLANAWLAVPRTIFEIVDVRFGDSLSLRDLRTGDWLDVHDSALTRQARPDLLVCARAVPDGEGYQFVGTRFFVRSEEEPTVLALCEAGDGEGLCAWRSAH